MAAYYNEIEPFAGIEAYLSARSVGFCENTN